jgi:hypothetical protein
MYKYISYIYSNTYLTKTNIGQVLSSRIAQMVGRFWMLLITNSRTAKSFINHFICKGLDGILLGRREL